MISIELLQIIKILILPPALQFLLLLGGVLLLKRSRRMALTLLSLALLSLYLLSLPAVARQLAQAIEIYPPLDLSAPAVKQAGAIVILGAGPYANAPEYGGDTSSSRQLERLRYGALLHEKLGLPMLLSGGRVLSTGPSEAEIMQQTLVQSFQQQALWLESDSRNTQENAVRSFELLEARHITRIILVTHASHMRRAVLRFEQAGFSVIPAPTIFKSVRGYSGSLAEWLPASHALHTSTVMLHEVFGLLALRLGR